MAGITEDLQREIDAYCKQEFVFSVNGLPTKCLVYDAMLDPRQVEIANLKGELESARYEAAQARKLAYAAKAERDMALQSLAELIQHFMYPPATAEEDPAVRAVRVMQNIGAAR
jgi:septal ring factor EnvC (AmiA/AmiB activator)